MGQSEEFTFRPMRRSKQALPLTECQDILDRAYRGFLSVIGDGGYPYSFPINFYHEDGKVYFHSALEGHKIDALRACEKACFTVLDEPVREPGDWWYHVKSVICFGRLREITDETLHDETLRKFGRKYFPGEGYLEKEMAASARHAAVLELTIEHITGKAVREK
ncbi:MAG: pyridoxamine 5'-phosphate oxidase family protein [Bacteroidales bacterium]|nr:pyridoxamine 5'-phosphate oxidase family protein [Bacteroidales bacterium]